MARWRFRCSSALPTRSPTWWVRVARSACMIWWRSVNRCAIRRPSSSSVKTRATKTPPSVINWQGVVFGQQYLMLDYDCPRSVLDDATAVTPGLESPTIAPLADPAWVAVRALVPRRDVNGIMDELAAIGAKAILASDIRFCRF